MNPIYLAIGGLLAIMLSYLLVVLFLLRKSRKVIDSKESEIIELFFLKVNKIPAMVEIMKKYTTHPDVFEDIIYFHKLSIIYNVVSIYDILELNQRIYREFQFLMKLSAKIPELHRDGNFLYVRNYVIFYENALEKEIKVINSLFSEYNKLAIYKNFSLIGLIFPIKKMTVI